jgi:phosphocarrier protein
MVQRTVTILNRAGMHARPAAMFVQLASKFKSRIGIDKAGLKVNGKSIMGVIQLGASYNTKLVLEAEGEDEAQALDALEALFLNRFEEEKPEA